MTRRQIGRLLGRGLAVALTATITAVAVLLSAATGAFGQAEWSPQVSGTTKGLYSVDFVDASHGWAVGEDGTILATSNGGGTWTLQTSNTSSTLSCVDFVDDSHGWAAGGGAILRTVDGGVNWTPLSSDTTRGPSAVAFVDGLTGWAVGVVSLDPRGPGSGFILKTTDGGVTWASQTPSMTPALFSVFFIDASTGWAGAGGSVLRTTDGGTTWASVAAGTPRWLTSVYFADASHGWAVGRQGFPPSLSVILRSTDGGASWMATETPPNPMIHLLSVHFVDLFTGWAVGPTILKSVDGGVTWTPQSAGTQFSLQSVDFVDATHGWAVGESGTILHLEAEDTTPPTTISHVDVSPTGTQVSLTATDNGGGSGVAHTYYRLDSGNVTTYTAPFEVNVAAGFTLEFWSVDNAGNVETHNVATVPPSGTDAIPPTTFSDARAIYHGSATISLTATDNGGTPIVHTFYALDGDADTTYTVPVVVSTPGTHTIEFWSVNQEGDIEVPIAATFFVDRLPSTVTIRSSRSTVKRGQSFILSGYASPSPGMVGQRVRILVRRPVSAVWTTFAKRWVYTDPRGRPIYTLRYVRGRRTAGGTWIFRTVYDGDAFKRSASNWTRVLFR